MAVKKTNAKSNGKKDFQTVVSKLENMILTGAFKPRERLIEANLSQMFGVSRYWIRDAFKIMETKGLVTVIPFKGVMVSELSEQELNEIFVIRVNLEQLAWKLSMENATESDLKTIRRMVEKIEEAHKKDDILGMVEADTNFHDFVFRLCQNRTLRRMIKDLRNRCHIIRYSAWSSPDMMRQVLNEHRQFGEAMENKDAASLERLASEHINRAKQSYIFQLKAENALKL